MTLEEVKTWLKENFPRQTLAWDLNDWELEDLAAELEELGLGPGRERAALAVAKQALRRAQLKRAEFRLVGKYPCPACGGSGEEKEGPCAVCKGTGAFTVEASLREALEALGIEVP